MKRLFSIVVLGLITILLINPVSAQEALIIGVAPHTSARVILQMYQPLRLHLEKALKMTVDIVTAPDFTDFGRRALAQEFDLAITTAHQARLLQTDAAYQPLLTYKADFKAVALVSAKGPIHQPRDLKGKNVLGLSPSSLVTLWGQHWLIDNGLGATAIQYVSASDSVAQLVLSGQAAAGFTSLANFQNLTPEVQSQLRFLAESPPMAGRIYLLNNRRAAQKKAIETALWDFSKTTEGLQYFEKYKLEGYRKLRPKELNSMDRYAAEVRKILSKNEK
jgi:phosphonate transport system substrate-binding protein